MMRPVLLWDVMGTLVHDPFLLEMPEFFGMSFDAMLASKHPSAWVEFEVGRRTESEFLSDFFRDHRDFDHRGFIDAVRTAYRWLPGMEELLADLRASGCTMHAFSNYPVWYELVEQRLGLSRFLEWTFVSCRTGLRKPDPAAYRSVVEELGIPAEQLVFVDDRESNCEAARQSGMGSVKFEGADSLRAYLAETGVL
ncbi:MAG: HAD family phosphatase [Deltaproteobacteria bacterium]|nr:HAD family phosphatase [Deltaproteobacteria bacterium]